jgi:hypothetical protein
MEYRGNAPDTKKEIRIKENQQKRSIFLKSKLKHMCANNKDKKKWRG